GHEPSAVRGAVDPERRMHHAGRRWRPRGRDSDRHVLVALRRALDRVLTRPEVLRAGGRVIDVGAGEAPYRALFEARGAEYIGCDIDGEAQVRFLPGQPIPLADGRADLVTWFQGLEHVWDVGWYLGECRRLVAPSGHLLLSTHGVWPYHPHPTDYRRWTRPGLLGEIETAGFTIVEVDGLVGPLAWTTQIRLLAYSQAARRLPVIGGALAAALALGMNTRMVLEDRITPASVRQDHAELRLLVVSNYYDNHVGGIEAVAGQLARRLVRRGVELTWAAAGPAAKGVPARPLRSLNVLERRLGLPFPICSPVDLALLLTQVRCY